MKTVGSCGSSGQISHVSTCPRSWCNGQHGCLPSIRRGFDSPRTHDFLLIFSALQVTFLGLAIVISYTVCWLPFWVVQLRALMNFEHDEFSVSDRRRDSPLQANNFTGAHQSAVAHAAICQLRCESVPLRFLLRLVQAQRKFSHCNHQKNCISCTTGRIPNI